MAHWNLKSLKYSSTNFITGLHKKNKKRLNLGLQIELIRSLAGQWVARQARASLNGSIRSGWYSCDKSQDYNLVATVPKRTARNCTKTGTTLARVFYARTNVAVHTCYNGTRSNL